MRGIWENYQSLSLTCSHWIFFQIWHMFHKCRNYMNSWLTHAEKCRVSEPSGVSLTDHCPFQNSYKLSWDIPYFLWTDSVVDENYRMLISPVTRPHLRWHNPMIDFSGDSTELFIIVDFSQHHWKLKYNFLFSLVVSTTNYTHPYFSFLCSCGRSCSKCPDECHRHLWSGTGCRSFVDLQTRTLCTTMFVRYLITFFKNNSRWWQPMLHWGKNTEFQKREDHFLNSRGNISHTYIRHNRLLSGEFKNTCPIGFEHSMF